jgi:hypothetical protein
MQCYTEILKEDRMKASQTARLSFFQKKGSIKLSEPQHPASDVVKASQLPPREGTSLRFPCPPSSPIASSDPDDPTTSIGNPQPRTAFKMLVKLFVYFIILDICLLMYLFIIHNKIS